MTPEEKRVVQAAIDVGAGGEVNALYTAIDALIFSCPECNRGGHECPGDGASIPHGDADCGSHAEIGVAPMSAPEWIITEWRYVRGGDKVRLGTTEADVETTSEIGWHTDPRSSQYDPRPMNHSKVSVRLSGRPMMQFDPHGSIEILMGSERLAIHTLALKFGNVVELSNTTSEVEK